MTKNNILASLLVLYLLVVGLGACNSSDKSNTTHEAPARELITMSGNFEADTAASVLQWTGKKPTGSHTGTLKLSSGTFQVHNGILTSGKFVVDMNSMICTDITDPVDNKDFVEHLRDTDFFDVPNFPFAVFEIEEVRKTPEGNTYQVAGSATIKGKSHPLTLVASVTEEPETLIWNSAFTIDRTLYGLTYKSKTVFRELGNKFIDDQMYFEIHLRAKKK